MKVKLLQMFAILFLMASCTQAQWNWGQTIGGQTNGGTSGSVSAWGGYNPGNFVTLNSTGNGYGRNIASDNYGNTYIAMSYDSVDIYIGNPSVPVEKIGGRTTLLYKINSAGIVQWYRRFGVVLGDAQPYAISLDTTNNKIFISGIFQPTSTIRIAMSNNPGVLRPSLIDIAFETSTPGSFTNEMASVDRYVGSPDGFVACYGLDGTFNWATQISTTPNNTRLAQQAGSIQLYGIANDGLGNCYTTGWTQSWDIQVGNTNPLVFFGKGVDSTFFFANGDMNSHIRNSWIGGADLSGMNISSVYYNSSLWASSGSNLYTSYDYGINWRQVDFSNFASPVTCINGPGGTPLVATQSNGLFCGLNLTSTSAGVVWSQMAATPNINTVAFYNGVTGYTGQIAYGTSDAGLYYTINGSTNGGIVWNQANTLPSSNIKSLFYANNGKTLLAGAVGSGLYYSTRLATTLYFGSTWTKANGIGNQTIYAINSGIGSPGYTIAAADSGVYKSTDNGVNWIQWGPGPIYDGSGNLLSCTSALGNNYSDPTWSYNYRIIAGTTQGVFVTYSVNGGNTWTAWTRVGNGLDNQNIPLNGIAIYNNRGVFFATNNSGLIYSAFTGLSNQTSYTSTFFVKLNSSGQGEWIKVPRSWVGTSSVSSQVPVDIIADNSGFYATGSMGANDPLIFTNSFTGLKTALSSTNNKSSYLVKYGTDGNPLWAHQYGLPNTYPGSGSATTGLMSLALDGAGSLYGTGFTSSTSVMFDGASAIANPNGVNNCMTLAKFSTSDGNCNWLTVDGVGGISTVSVYGTAIGINPATKNIFVGGSFRNAVSITNNTLIPGANNIMNPFLAVYHDNLTSVSPVNSVSMYTLLNSCFNHLSVSGNDVVISAEFLNDNLSLLGTNYPKQALGNNLQQNFFFARGTYNNSLFTVSPAAPVQTLPVNNETGITSTSVHFTWDPVASAEYYQLQVSASAGFATTLFNDSLRTTNDTTIVSFASTNNTPYFWRVRAKVGGVWTAYSPTWKFTSVTAVPTVPVLSAPAALGANIAVPVIFTWTAATNPDTQAIKYRLQVSTDTTFATNIIVDDSTIATVSKTILGLSNGTKYFWRVSAKNSVGTSAWSISRGFTTVILVPGVPNVLLPADLSTELGTAIGAVTFTWDAVPNAATYTVQYAKSPDFLSSAVTLSAVTTTFKANAAILTAATVYYWHVLAVNPGGSSVYSPARVFGTTGATVPATPNLTSPASGAPSVYHNVTFTWTAGTGTSAAFYRIQVASDSLFTSIVSDYDSIYATTKTVTLNDNTTYYWRVLGTNFIGTGSWTAFRSFTTAKYQLYLSAFIEGLWNNTTNHLTMDTITVELHNATAPYALLETQRGIIDTSVSNGTQGMGSFFFNTAVNGTPYFIVIKHRNAVETWSADANPFFGSTMTYNFTNAASKSFGNNLVLKGTKYCLYSGDANNDGLIDGSDLSAIENDVNASATGYLVTDLNGDGLIDASDYAISVNNNNKFISRIVPSGYSGDANKIKSNNNNFNNNQ